MTKERILFLLVVNTLWIVLTILAITWGTRFDWPDNVHVDYGFPFVWSTNTLSTITGAVNIWTVDFTALTMNLGLWLGIMLVTEFILTYFLNKE